jgi:hypothetical protein
MHHVTQAKRKIKTFLVTYLPAMLANADAIRADGIVTPMPYEVHTTDKADLGGLPSLEVFVTDSGTTKNTFAQIYRHRLVIGVSVGGDTEETLAVQVETYMWCLRQLFRDAALVPVLGTGPVDTGGEQYTPLQQRPGTVENPFVKGAFIEIFVTTVE